MPRYIKTALEFTAAFLGVLGLVMAVVIWRLGSSPISSTFLTPAQIAHTLLAWDNADHSVAFHADGLVIKNASDKIIAEVPKLDIRLSLLGFVVGQFMPTELTVDHPQIKLSLRKDGRLYFAGMSAASEDDSGAGDTREAMRKALLALTRAYAMRHLTVYRAVVDVHDEATNGDWSVDVPEISLKRTFTQLAGDAKIDVAQKDQTSSMELHYVYDHSKTLHRLSARFKEITPAQFVGGHPQTLGLDAAMLDVPISGEMEAAFDPDLNIAAVAATLHGGAGHLKIPALWDKPRSVGGFDLEGDYDRAAHRLNIATASFDFDGAKLKVTATGQAPADAKKYDLDFDMAVGIENWPMNSFGDLWPKPLIPDARAWMLRNLAKGSYDKGEAKFTGSLSWKDLANIAMTEGHGKILASHAEVSYIDGMPPVENVSTEAIFDLNQMTLQISEGGIGNLRLLPFTIVMTGFADTTQYIDIPLRLTGPIAEVVHLIDHPPLHYAQKIGLLSDSITGKAEGAVDLHFPLLKSLDMKDIDVKVNATLSGLASSQLIEGVDLSQGELTLVVDKDGFEAKGSLAIDKAPFQAVWQQYFHQMPGKPLRQANFVGNVKDEQWKSLGIEALADTRGSATVTVQMSQDNRGKTLFSGTIDLTAADLRVGQLNWVKSAGVPATLQFTAEMPEGRDIDVTLIQLRGEQGNAKGRAVVRANGKIKSARFEPLMVGRISANVYFTQSEGEDGALSFEARGAAFDVAGMKGGKDPARADPRPKEYHVKVDKLYTSDNGFIAKAEGSAVRDVEGWSAIDFHGLADGEHKLDIVLKPHTDGSRNFSIFCDDFGKMLKGLGFTDTVKSGEVKIVGGSTSDNPRAIEGTVKIGSFSVGKLPVLMLLLNATSPFGFVGIVTDSVSFDHLKGWFRWTGDEVELKRVNAAGSAVGMNIDGKVDMNSGNANLNGTLVPFSMVNRILNSIPIIGDILTGGEGGGVLAVAYDIKGTLIDPKIGVNPVSLLTPGFLRNLFFSGGGDDEDKPE
jgi:hypothetical protein